LICEQHFESRIIESEILLQQIGSPGKKEVQNKCCLQVWTKDRREKKVSPKQRWNLPKEELKKREQQQNFPFAAAVHTHTANKAQGTVEVGSF
jgi:hypothetical protein